MQKRMQATIPAMSIITPFFFSLSPLCVYRFPRMPSLSRLCGRGDLPLHGHPAIPLGLPSYASLIDGSFWLNIPVTSNSTVRFDAGASADVEAGLKKWEAQSDV